MPETTVHAAPLSTEPRQIRIPAVVASPLPADASIAPTQTTAMLAQTCQLNVFFSKTVESTAVGSGTALLSNWLMESDMKTSDQLLNPMLHAWTHQGEA